MISSRSDSKLTSLIESPYRLGAGSSESELSGGLIAPSLLRTMAP
jgi:hypothetical protein